MNKINEIAISIPGKSLNVVPVLLNDEKGRKHRRWSFLNHNSTLTILGFCTETMTRADLELTLCLILVWLEHVRTSWWDNCVPRKYRGQSLRRTRRQMLLVWKAAWPKNTWALMCLRFFKPPSASVELRSDMILENSRKWWPRSTTSDKGIVGNNYFRLTWDFHPRWLVSRELWCSCLFSGTVWQYSHQRVGWRWGASAAPRLGLQMWQRPRLRADIRYHGLWSEVISITDAIPSALSGKAKLLHICNGEKFNSVLSDLLMTLAKTEMENLIQNSTLEDIRKEMRDHNTFLYEKIFSMRPVQEAGADRDTALFLEWLYDGCCAIALSKMFSNMYT